MATCENEEEVSFLSSANTDAHTDVTNYTGSLMVLGTCTSLRGSKTRWQPQHYKLTVAKKHHTVLYSVGGLQGRSKAQNCPAEAQHSPEPKFQ